jgi:thymidine phosphorylase
MEVTLALSARMLHVTGTADSLDSALEKLHAAIESGAGLNKFREMVELQGGDLSVLDDPSRLPAAKIRKSVAAQKGGRVVSVDAEAIGKAALVLGAGRVKTSGKVDHAVGVSKLVKRGAAVAVGEEIAVLHANEESRLAEAEQILEDAFSIDNSDFKPGSRIKDFIQAST